MEVKLGMTELKNIFKKYYKEQENVEARVSIGVTREIDRFYEEHYSEVKVTKKVNILGKDRTCTEILTEKQMKDILKEMLVNDEYEVEKIEFEYGTTSSMKGYGLAEETVYRPYFHALVTVTKKDNKNLTKKIKY